MSEIEVATSVTVLGLEYNQQATNPSMYQKRIQSYLYPTQSGDISSPNASSLTVKFLVGSNFFLDGQNTYMVLNAQMNGFNSSDPNNYAYFTSYADTWIKSLTIYTNQGLVIEQIRDYNVLASILKLSMSENYLSSVGLSSLGIYDSLTVGQRQTIAQQGRRYVIEMRGSGFLHSKNYLFLRGLAGQNSNSVQVEIEFAPYSDVIVAWNQTTTPPMAPAPGQAGAAGYGPYNPGSSQLGYTFSNIIISQSLVQDDVTEARLMEVIKHTPIMIHYETFRNYQNSISGSGNGETLSISEYQESVRDMKNVFRYQSDLGKLAIDQTWFIDPNLQQYQLQIGPIYLPSQPLKTGFLNAVPGFANGIADLAEQYYEYAKCNQKVGFTDEGLYPTQVPTVAYGANNPGVLSSRDTVNFVLTEDMRPFPDYALGDPSYIDFISGYNTKSSPQPLQLLLSHRAQTNSLDVVCNSFTHFDAYAVIQSNEVYILS